MPSLVFVEGKAKGKSVPVTRALILGREKGEVDVPVADVAASREHCKVFSQDGDWFVIDLGSRNGTRVNETRISRWHLSHGDVITIGKTHIRFDAPEIPPREPEGGAAPAVPASPAASSVKPPPPAPRGPSALERERERLRAEASRPQEGRRAKDDGSGVVVREKVLQYGRIDARGGLLRDDIGQRGAPFKVAVALVLAALFAGIVWVLVGALSKEVVEDPNVPEETGGGG